MTKLKPSKCPDCGKKYIRYEIHVTICEKNKDESHGLCDCAQCQTSKENK